MAILECDINLINSDAFFLKRFHQSYDPHPSFLPVAFPILFNITPDLQLGTAGEVIQGSLLL